MDGFLSGFVNADKQIAVWQQIVQKRNKLAYKAAGIIADIEYERLCALCRELFDSADRAITASGFKVFDFDIADIILQHF